LRTSNCYFTSLLLNGLRDYGMEGQIGLEDTVEAYVAKMVEVFRECRRVLKKDGVCWLNLSDSYWGGKGQSGQGNSDRQDKRYEKGESITPKTSQMGGTGITRAADKKHPIIKPKDLIGIPWRVAFALQADGWWLRQDIVWCLSGGTWIYARTQKGDMPMMIRDIIRLKEKTVKLWNGKKWTNLWYFKTRKKI
jgi:hypothetical protein